MGSDLHVEVVRTEDLEDAVRIQGRVGGHPRSAGRNGVFFFEVPPRCREWLAIRGRSDDLHDAFLRATIWSAMEAGGSLTVHGRVSRTLLANLERYQEIVCRWWPKYRPVVLRADEEVGDEQAPPGTCAGRAAPAVLAYSGGLDGTESLFAHKGGLRGRNTLDVQACVFVHGFDIPLRDPAFGGAAARARALVESFSTELVLVRSNLKEMLPLWETTFSAGIAAVLSLFERRFAVGLLAASTAYENTHWIGSEDGSTPWSDPLLSSATFRLVPDLAVTRVEKTERLAREERVWRSLRVCWEGGDPSTNCGRCEKCVRQMLCMRASGVRDFSAFERPLTPAAVRATEVSMPVVVEEWRRCYERAVERGVAGDAVFVAMKEVLERAPEGVGRAVGSRLRRLRRRVGRRLRRLGLA